jgi:hypothetical protein
MTYNVNKVRKHQAENGNHQHIIGVLTTAGVYYSNKEVNESMNAGNEWFTDVTGQPKAKIKPLTYCPNSTCHHKPYLTTGPDHTDKNNLESLPPG